MGDRRRRTVWFAGGLATAVVLAVTLVWFQPQRLLYDDVVEEELPTSVDAEPPPTVEGEAAGAEEDGGQVAAAEGGVDEGGAAPSEVMGPVDLQRGSFVSLGRYTTEGTVRVVQLEDGQRIVRLEGFATTNGPDLYVYLTDAPADGSEPFTRSFVDLGRLRGNVGDQNYEIPAEVDLDGFTSVAIWCERFSTPFGAADLIAIEG